MSTPRNPQPWSEPELRAEADLQAEAEAFLRVLVGPAATLHEDQWAAIKALVADRARVLVIQRTGWGKSAVYWTATALLRARGAGVTVVVSPLLALMRDQVAAAERSGLTAATINSANLQEWPALEAAVLANQLDVLLISPERLNSHAFRTRVLQQLAGRIGLVVINEAHYVSDWGHDFRPDYLRLRQLIAGLPERTPVLATTATANARVTADVADQIGTRTLTLRGNLDRESLALSVVPTPDVATAYAWIADALHSLPGSGIIYTLTVADTTKLAAFLASCGHPVGAYSSATPPEERTRLEEALLRNEVRALVATSSLGMGLDKGDLAFVLHLGAPSSPIAYYQQVGRAGRALPRAEAVLLPTAGDTRIWAYFDSTSMPPEAVVRRVLGVLDSADGPMSVPALGTAAELRPGRLETLLKILDVDGAVRRVAAGYVSTGVKWRYDSARYDAVAASRRVEQATMLRYLAARRCLMRCVRESLDDAGAADCGRCSVCTGVLPTPGASQSPDTVTVAGRYLRAVQNVLEPRKMWPAGATRRGRIPPAERAEPGRALAFAADPGWGDAVREALEQDEPVAAEVFDGVVAVLSRWGWPAGRPVAVAVMPSESHPRLLVDLAERLGALGRLRVCAPLEGDRRTGGTVESGARTSTMAADEALRRLRRSGQVPAGPLLLLDASGRSGWSMAVAASLLRAAGAGPVYPLVLHNQP